MTEIEAWEAEAVKDIEHVAEMISTPRSTEGNALAVELDNLAQWLARIGELHSEAKSMYESALGATIEELYKDEQYRDMATSLFKQIAQGKCADLLKISLRIEKLYSSLVHTIEVTRSLLSREKELMRINNNTGKEG